MKLLNSDIPPATLGLVAANVIIFFLGNALIGGAPAMLALHPLESPYFRFWQLASYLFLHAGLAHLAFNMIALWSFGRVLEQVWGSARFLLFFVACGVGAGLAHLAISAVTPGLPAVGASGAVYGTLVAFALLFPDFKLLLIFLPIPIKARYFVPVLLLVDLTAGLTGVSILGANIAHFAHLGGALAGFLLLQFWLKPRGLQQG